MIRVLQVLPGLNRGGLETFVMNVYRTIDKSKVQFDFLINMEGGDYAKEIKELGGNIFYIPPRKKGIISYYQNLKSFFKKNGHKYNAIHYHESSLTSLEVLYFAKQSNIKTRIMHSHNSSIMGNKLHYVTHYIGKMFISSLANTYYGCSDKALKWMYGSTGIRNKAVMINNGIDVQLFKYDNTVRNEVRKNLGIQKNEILVGHVGRFSNVKNHTYLIDIFKTLKNKEKSAKLILIGVGELQKEIREKVDDLQLSDSVIFMGLRSDTQCLYQAMDIFVMPSLYEGLPVVLVEAQAAGLPILGSDTISKMSIMSENYDMLSIRDTVDKWANKIIEKTTSPIDRTMGVNNVIKAGFDINKVAELLTLSYEN